MTEPSHIRVLRVQLARATLAAREHPADIAAQRALVAARSRYRVARAAFTVRQALTDLDDQQRANVLKDAAA